MGFIFRTYDKEKNRISASCKGKRSIKHGKVYCHYYDLVIIECIINVILQWVS